MKTCFTFVALLFCFFIESNAQAPQAIPYQAVARNNAGNPIANQFVSLRFTIHDATANGTIVYRETQNITTNSLGLFTANIGMGIPVNGTFAAIDWGTNAKFIQVEIDIAGGVIYVDMGTQQMLSVPYSIYAKTSGSSSSVSGTANFLSRFTGANTVGNSIIFDNGTNIGIGNNSPASLFSVGLTSQFQINSSGSIGSATGIMSSGTIQFSGLSTNGIVRTSGGTGILSSSGGGINLSTEVTGILSVANGGTGSSSLNFLDLTSNQFVGGLKTFTNIPTGTTVGAGTIYINPATNGGSASNTLMGLAVGGIEKFIVDASGNIKSASLAGIGTRMVQTDANGVLIPLASGTASQVLLGNGVWGSVPTTNVWSLTGNAGTVAGTNFLGTTDSQPLMFKVNNQKAGYVDSLSKVSAFGYHALNTNTGEHNTSLGYYALKSNTTAEFNTAVGSTALQNNTDGGDNTAIGLGALRQNISGNGNTATGSFALITNTGGNNTAVGFFALSQNTSGNENTAIGFNANIGALGINNATAIGANATVSQSNSLVLGSNANVGIGTSAPTFRLEVTEDVSFNSVKVGRGGGSVYENTAVGNFVLDQNAIIGLGNTGIGFRALRLNFTGSNNTAVGAYALESNNIASNNTAFGFESLMQNNADDNTAVGHHALASNITGHGNTAIGLGSLKDNSSGHNNVALGINALTLNFTGSENIAIGSSSLGNNFGGGFNIAIGNSALSNNNAGSYNIAIGSGADIFSPVPVSNATAIGSGAIVSQSNSIVLGNNANVGIGTSTPVFKLEVTDEASFHGVKVGRGGGAFIENTAVGLLVLNQNGNGIGNTGTGYHALRLNFTGSNNTATGVNALSNNGSGSNNTAMGFESLMQNNGIENTAVGYHALLSNDLSNGNTAIGSEALNDNTLGNNNAALGTNVMNSNIDGDENTAIGNSALGNNIGGNNNTAIGSGANVSNGFLTNATAIGFGAIVSQSNSLVLGNSADVGIGTSSPTAKLEVVGDVKASSTITSSALSTPGIVTNNSNGLLGTTTAVPVSNGGTGTTSIFTPGSVVFAGLGGVYSEDASLFFDQSNIRLGIGLMTPLEKLHVVGNGLFTGDLTAVKGSFTNDISALNGTFLGNVTASCGVLVCSDARYKKSITPLSGSLEKLRLLNGVNYYFKKDEFPELNFNDDKQIGLIAQEVEKILPELVKTDVKGYKSVDYAKLTPVLVEAIKELKAANDLLKTDIEKIIAHLGLEVKAEK